MYFTRQIIELHLKIIYYKNSHNFSLVILHFSKYFFLKSTKIIVNETIKEL